MEAIVLIAACRKRRMAAVWLFCTCGALVVGGTFAVVRLAAIWLNVATNLLAETSESEHIAKLKSYVPTATLKKVPEDFFTYGGYRDWYRFPLVYPYSVHMCDVLTEGQLCKHDGHSSIPDGQEYGMQGAYAALTHLNFDGKLMVARSNDAGGTWVLFDFKTGNATTYPSEPALLTAAKAAGYTGDQRLWTLKERFYQCD